MFLLQAIKNEINRSKSISKTANEVSKEVERKYVELDNKYRLNAEKRKLERIPYIRRSIVNNFMKDLRETEARLDSNNYNKNLKKVTIQRFLERLAHLNDNQRGTGQNI